MVAATVCCLRSDRGCKRGVGSGGRPNLGSAPAFIASLAQRPSQAAAAYGGSLSRACRAIRRKECDQKFAIDRSSERRCRHRSSAIYVDEYVLADLRLTEVIDLLNLRCTERGGE